MTSNEINAQDQALKEFNKQDTITRDMGIMKEYLLLKFREHDWHGVSDAANDLREMEIKRGLNG